MTKIQLLVLFVITVFILSCNRKNVSIISDTNKDTDKEIVKKNEEKENSEDDESISVFAFDFKSDKYLGNVLDIAKSQNKPVFVDINAKWCAPCKLMQRDVYTHKETAQFFNENFINYKVDIELNEGPDLKLIYNIKTIPTLLWLDEKGREIYRKEGACYHSELLNNASIALQKTNKQ